MCLIKMSRGIMDVDAESYDVLMEFIREKKVVRQQKERKYLEKFFK